MYKCRVDVFKMGKSTKVTSAQLNASKKEQALQAMKRRAAGKKPPKTLCLAMIVKNESANMERLLNSLIGIIDFISIVDTGSIDNTAEIIVAWGQEHKLPTTVHHEPFKSFCYNRTHSVQMAKKTYPSADYILLSDADFIWEKTADFNKTFLFDEMYDVEQYTPHVSYANIRILSTRVDWVCRLRTHEFWIAADDQSTYKGHIHRSKVTTLKINDKEDGGCKSDKFERDERLLREDIADPNIGKWKSRCHFYLAQTLRDLGRWDESVEEYKTRITFGPCVTPEEVYIAMYQVGNCNEKIAWAYRYCIELLKKKCNQDDREACIHLGEDPDSVEESSLPESDLQHLEKWNPDKLGEDDLENKAQHYFSQAVEWYLKAHKERKHRAEALYNACRLLRTLSSSNSQRVYDLCLIGNSIKYPEHDALFVEPQCYDYLFDFEISIVGFYCNRTEGAAALASLLQRSDIPEWYRNTCESNAKYYL
jgi:glycosyltransferase involved in cell wall biosynthesis